VANPPPTTLELLVDQIERIREELLAIQRKLETMESANQADSDGAKKH
jgi:hypothetical protein